MQTVTMRSPNGDIREVEATAAALTPYMAAGWHQAPPETVHVRANPLARPDVAPPAPEGK